MNLYKGGDRLGHRIRIRRANDPHSCPSGADSRCILRVERRRESGGPVDRYFIDLRRDPPARRTPSRRSGARSSADPGAGGQSNGLPVRDGAVHRHDLRQVVLPQDSIHERFGERIAVDSNSDPAGELRVFRQHLLDGARWESASFPDNPEASDTYLPSSGPGPVQPASEMRTIGLVEWPVPASSSHRWVKDLKRLLWIGRRRRGYIVRIDTVTNQVEPRV